MSILSQPITLQSLFGPQRKIGPINAQVVPNESTSDILTITKQPVQKGAPITDHAYKEPTTFSMTAFFKENGFVAGLANTFSGGGLQQLYQDLLDLQASRIPFDVITPKRVYPSMLMAGLSQTTDKTTENCLSVTMSFQQVLIVNIGVIQVDPSKLKNPGSNAATRPSGPKSVIKSLSEGARALAGRG